MTENLAILYARYLYSYRKYTKAYSMNIGLKRIKKLSELLKVDYSLITRFNIFKCACSDKYCYKLYIKYFEDPENKILFREYLKYLYSGKFKYKSCR